MAKKCIICGSKAELCVKDSSEFYCSSCAEENFSDINMLVKIEEDAVRLNNFVEDRIKSKEDEEEEDSEDNDA
ncbi:MAG: hypothetical protein NT001_07800 [Candidatus Woesearchaeota archaeon]|nr:hypothetical protein [Candidatus Woesearchaeota archaeon]